MTDYDKAYVDFHQRLLTAFIAQIENELPFSGQQSEDDAEFLHELKQLPNSGGSEQLIQGQNLLCKIVSSYPHLMPLLPRDLLWFFGGDCLHYMPDEEIALFQQLDEERQAAQESGEDFSYEQTRASKMGLH